LHKRNKKEQKFE